MKTIKLYTPQERELPRDSTNIVGVFKTDTHSFVAVCYRQPNGYWYDRRSFKRLTKSDPDLWIEARKLLEE
jgi:hypothetical protein